MVINGGNKEGENMKIEKIKEMVDACYLAKRIRDMLPKLPDGVAPSYIRIMNTIQELEIQDRKVKVSDISEVLNLPRPGVTRTVKEMEAKGYLKKISSDEDGRITYVTLTDEGEKLSEKYDRQYFRDLSKYLDDISEQEADCMIDTIEKLYKIMWERKNHFE